MTQFNSTFKGQKVIVNFSGATDPFESLEGVEIFYSANGEEIDYDDIPDTEWGRLQEEVQGEFQAWHVDAVRWD